jgi:hypothetical protein
MKQGKRYIRLPILDEIMQEQRAAFEAFQQSEGDMGNPELVDLLFRVFTADAIAKQWITSLKPSFPVAWLDDFWVARQVYRPESGMWEESGE